MRILFTACPMYGHVNPLLSLALAADRRGHDVVLATGPDLAPYVARHGVHAWPVGPTHRQAGGGPDADWLRYFAAAGPARAADLLPRAAAWRPELVVADETELAGPVVAAATRARLAVHGLGIMPAPPVVDAYLAALAALHRDRRLPFDADAVRASTYLDVCPPRLRPDGERAWPNAIPVRPALPEPLQGLPAAVDALPHADTVHLTLGTVYHGNSAVLRNALRGLGALSVNVVVAAGPGADPATLGPQPANVLVEAYVPYPQLMPKCRLVVSQGGFGVMLAGLGHGIPQLVLPLGADQFRNAEACRAAGAGLVLDTVPPDTVPPDTVPPAAVTPAAVTAAATRLLEEPSFTAAARAVQAEIDGMPGADATLAALASPEG